MLKDEIKKASENRITVCPRCHQCVDCCIEGIQCEGFHLDYLTLRLAELPDITEPPSPR